MKKDNQLSTKYIAICSKLNKQILNYLSLTFNNQVGSDLRRQGAGMGTAQDNQV